MIEKNFDGKKITIAGLGRFGGSIAAARWLANQGALVTVTDLAPAEKLQESIAQLSDLPIQWQLGGHRMEDFTNVDLVVASPAIAPSNVYLQASRAHGVPITTEIVLFIERCKGKIVAVTGTKGKSTTTALLELMLKTRHRVFAGGNIGKSLLNELANITGNDLVVLELSSFMLHYLREIKFAPHLAIITMIASDHIEWHLTQQAYVSDKLSIMEFQSVNDFAVLNENCETCNSVGSAVRTDFPGSANSVHDAAMTKSKIIRFGVDGRRRFSLMIPGEHNQANAQGAFAAAQILGVTFDEAQKAVADFKGLSHRLSLVHEKDGVRFFDDSNATIPDAAIVALKSFPDKTVIQIVGGYNKGLPFDKMCEQLNLHAKAVLCIGATGEAIFELLQKTSRDPSNIFLSGDLATAMRRAGLIAIPGDVVLLSTGCSSFDQFENYQMRGKKFAQLANGGMG